MLDARAVGTRTTLAKPLSASATQVYLPLGGGATFALAAGDHTYLTLRQGDLMERVRVTGRSGDVLQVTRGADNTSPRDWVAGTCINVEWGPAMMCEFVNQCVAGAAHPTGVTPGVYCLNSCACLTVASDGRITNIEQN